MPNRRRGREGAGVTAYYNEIEPSAILWLRAAMDAGVIAPGHIDTRPIQEVTANDLKGFAQCHFFAGVGGWSIALRMADWPDSRSVWTGSCPCQPFSSAGRQKGKADDRHLWPVWERLIREVRPEVVFGEQVSSAEIVGTELETAFIVAVQRGDYATANRYANRLTKTPSLGASERWLDDVYKGLEAEGYSIGAAVLPACSVGKAHRRERLWFVADCTGERLEKRAGRPIPDQKQPERCSTMGYTRLQRQAVGEQQAEGLEQSGEGIALANTVKQGLEGHARHDGREEGRQESHGSTTESDSFEWLLCPDGKQRPVKSGLLLLVDGLPGRLRKAALHGYGNAIVPQVAAEFIKAYMDVRS